MRTSRKMYSEGKGVEQNWDHGKNFFKKACEAGDSLGCSNLGEVYARCEGNSVKAKNLFQKACAGGADGVCYTNYILRFDTKACDTGDASACYNLGLMYASGSLVKPDLVKAKNLFQKAEDAGLIKGCKTYDIIK